MFSSYRRTNLVLTQRLFKSAKVHCLILWFMGVALATPFVASAADIWTIAGKPVPPSDAPLVNLGHVKLNSFGNRITTVRMNTKGFKLDMLTEYDCNARRTRSLSSSLSDPSGNLVNSSNGTGNRWYAEKDSVGLTMVCNASAVAN